MPDVSHRSTVRKGVLHPRPGSSAAARGQVRSAWRLLINLDADTSDHAHRVAAISIAIARKMDLDATYIASLRLGAVLHDVGKLAIPPAILFKPGPLTIAEWTVMRKHPAYARDILRAAQARQEVVDAAYSHHERWDGEGYPQRLRGAEIPLSARIVAVGDVVDSLSSTRPYRAAWPAAQIRDYVAAGAGTLFDPGVCEAYLGLRAA